MVAIAHRDRQFGLAAALAAIVLHVLLALAPTLPAGTRLVGFSAPICHVNDGATADTGQRHQAPNAPAKPCLACPICTVASLGGLLPAAVTLPGAPLLPSALRLLLPPPRAPPIATPARPPATGPPALT